MDDFVIVQPEAVRAIIQVKRTMTSAVLEKALENVVEAKRHVRDCGRSSIQLELVYSAVVTFEDDIKDRQDGSVSGTYANRLRKCHAEEKDAYTLPNFVGSLKTRFCGLNLDRPDRVTYSIYPSVHNDKYVGLQVILASMTQMVIEHSFYPRFGIPQDMASMDTIAIYEKAKAGSGGGAKALHPKSSS
jgi:hypothetical protein